MNKDKTIIKTMDNDEIRDFCIKKDLKIYELEKQLQQKENIIKEVREYIESYNLPKDLGVLGESPISISELNHILGILDKVGDEK